MTIRIDTVDLLQNNMECFDYVNVDMLRRFSLNTFRMVVILRNGGTIKFPFQRSFDHLKGKKSIQFTIDSTELCRECDNEICKRGDLGEVKRKIPNSVMLRYSSCFFNETY